MFMLSTRMDLILALMKEVVFASSKVEQEQSYMNVQCFLNE